MKYLTFLFYFKIRKLLLEHIIHEAAGNKFRSIEKKKMVNRRCIRKDYTEMFRFYLGSVMHILIFYMLSHVKDQNRSILCNRDK